MLEKIRKLNPLILISSTVVVLVICVFAVIGGVIVVKEIAHTTDKAFDETFIVRDNQHENLQHHKNYSNNSQSQLQMMKKLMTLQQQQMNSMINSSMNSHMAPTYNPFNLSMIDMNIDTPSTVNMKELPNSYIITIDMPDKDFDENAIDIDLDTNNIQIKINYKSKERNYVSSSSIYQSMSFSEPVNVSAVKRENIKNKHIITLPKIS